MPPWEQLQIHATGTDPTQPLTADLGCLDSASAGLFLGKHAPHRFSDLRAPYHHAMH